MAGNLSMAQRVALMTPEERTAVLEGLDPEALLQEWSFWARPDQQAPAGDWALWLMMAGRGCIAGDARLDLADGTQMPVALACAAGEPLEVLALHDDGSIRPTQAEAPFVKGIAEVWEVATTAGTVAVTAAHRFLAPHAWLRLDALQVGDHIAAGDGGQTEILAIRRRGVETFYDLHVPGVENYVAEGVVHSNSGKTRAASEWVHERVRAGHAKRIALLGRTSADVRDVMVQGSAGLIATARPGESLLWEPSKRLLTWEGTQASALVFSADAPDQLRGPQFDTAWCVAEGTPILTGRGPAAVEDIRAGDMVLTRSGYWPVRETMATGIRDVVEVSTLLADLVCTPDHKILVGDGRTDRWVEAGRLRSGDMVHVRLDAGELSHRVPVTGITPMGRAMVHDLSIDGMHEFYASGLLTRNCVASGMRVLVDDQWIPIQDVRVGQMAMTRQGPRRVLRTLAQGVKPVVKVTTTAGELRCTADHRIWVTGQGWVYAKDLQPGDMVRTWTRENLNRSQDRLTTSSGEVSDGTETPRTGITGSPVDTSSMSRFGKQPMARDRTVRRGFWTSITAMRTRPTTRWTTSNSAPEGSTSPTIVRNSLLQGAVTRLLSLAARRHGRTGGRLNASVFTVEPRSGLVPDGPRSTARVNALRPTAQPTRSSSVSAWNAGPPSASVTMTIRRFIAHGDAPIGRGFAVVPIAVRNSLLRTGRNGTALMPVESLAHVLSVEPDGSDPTYDLTISGEHEFFAENLLTHNCDEFASYPGIVGVDGASAFDNLRLGLRLPVSGDMPRMVATTTPRRVPAMFKVLEDAKNPDYGITITRATTYDNLANLADSFRATILGLYEGTRLGDQELMGNMLTDVEGALFSQENLDANRVTALPPGRLLTVVGVDPSVSERPRDEAGIVVVKATPEKDFFRRHLYVVEDASLLGSPSKWARRAVDMAVKWGAPIVAEGNQGGDLVRMAIGQVNPNIPVHIVHARAGKAIRAEPIALAADQNRFHLVGWHPLLESELTSWTPADTSYSPGHYDACTWASLALVSRVKGATFAAQSSNLRAHGFAHRRLPPMGAAVLAKRAGLSRPRH